MKCTYRFSKYIILFLVLSFCLMVGLFSDSSSASADDYQYAIWPFRGSVVFSQTYGPQTPNHHYGNVIDVCRADAYAPFDCYCTEIRSQGNGNQVLFQSANPVHLADGSLQIVKISFAHDEDISDCISWKNNNTLIKQGTKIYSPGNSGNSSGAHIHAMFGVTYECYYETIECAYGCGTEWRLNHTMDWNQAFFLSKDEPFCSYESNFDFTSNNILVKSMVTNFKTLDSIAAPVTSATLLPNSDQTITVGDKLTFNYSANAACNFQMHITKDGAELANLSVPASGSYSYKFTQSGQYCVWITAYNSKGSINSNDIIVTVKEKVGTLRVDGLLDGISNSTTSNYGTFDVYINEELNSPSCTQFNKEFAPGTEYKICNIQTVDGKHYDGELTITGTISAGQVSAVTLQFTTNGEATVEWQEGRVLPGNLNPEELDIQYKYHFEQVSESSPGTEWINSGWVRTEHRDIGGQYSTQKPLATSETRVFIDNYYYHWCCASKPAYANYEPTSVYVHYDQVQAPKSMFTEYGDRQDDNGYLWVFLKWTNGSDLSCKGGETCDDEHNYRNNRWYVGYIYQDRELHNFYKWTKDTDWSTSQQDGATSSSVRWRYKDGVPPIPPEEYVLTINGWLDGTLADYCFDYGCFDLYVDDEIVAEDCYGIEMRFDHDPYYRIENIRTAVGKKFNGPYAGALSGNIRSGSSTVTLSFSTIMDISENWTEVNSLPADMDLTGCDVEYKNRYVTSGRTSPGPEWSLYQQGSVQYENDGDPYTSPTELATSERVVQTGIFYFHWCGDPNDRNRSNWYQRPGVLDVYHTIFDVENYEVTSTNWDDGHSYHTFKNLNGQWVGGQTTCPDGCKYYYKGFIYQNKKPYQINTYIRESDWTNKHDPLAASVSVRVRRKLFEVHLKGNGGLPDADLQKFYNVPLDLSEYKPEREDCIFTGWNTDANGDGVSYNPESYYNENASITLYAQWAQIPVTVLPDSLREIEEEAFAGANLKIVRIPDGCERIHARAFAGCSELRKIYIPSSVVYIDNSAFDGIDSLIIAGEENSMAELFAFKCNWITFEAATN